LSSQRERARTTQEVRLTFAGLKIAVASNPVYLPGA
jgi:hypothetical protein